MRMLVVLSLISVLSSASFGNEREEMKAAFDEADKEIATMDCLDLRDEVMNIPDYVEKLKDKSDNKVEQATKSYMLSIMLKKIRWCIPTGKVESKSKINLHKPSRKSAEEAALIDWHMAIVSGNYREYLRLGFPASDYSEVDEKVIFDQMRLSAPKKIMIGNRNSNGQVAEYESVGCVGLKPVVGIISVEKVGSDYKVFGSGWGPSWNKDINDIHPCF